MAQNSPPTTEDLTSYSQEEIKLYIFSLQDALQSKLDRGLSMDDILDTEDPFEALEPLLPQEVYPILVLAMINNIRTDTVIDAVLAGLKQGIVQYRNRNDNNS
ncbi:MAG: hypothetical protein ISR89_01750 [Candidatus Marinimicrobia bacterium]|nr:hypothetical protein [Candidatus Neomarinimicrobiota bacterium]